MYFNFVNYATTEGFPLKERNKKTTEAKISRIHFYEKAENMFLIVHLNVWTVAYSSTFS